MEEDSLTVTVLKECADDHYRKLRRYNRGIYHIGDYRSNINKLNLEKLLYTETKLY